MEQNVFRMIIAVITVFGFSTGEVHACSPSKPPVVVNRDKTQNRLSPLSAADFPVDELEDLILVGKNYQHKIKNGEFKDINNEVFAVMINAQFDELVEKYNSFSQRLERYYSLKYKNHTLADWTEKKALYGEAFGLRENLVQIIEDLKNIEKATK